MIIIWEYKNNRKENNGEMSPLGHSKTTRECMVILIIYILIQIRYMLILCLLFCFTFRTKYNDELFLASLSCILYNIWVHKMTVRGPWERQTLRMLLLLEEEDYCYENYYYCCCCCYYCYYNWILISVEKEGVWL